MRSGVRETSLLYQMAAARGDGPLLTRSCQILMISVTCRKSSLSMLLPSVRRMRPFTGASSSNLQVEAVDVAE